MAEVVAEFARELESALRAAGELVLACGVPELRFHGQCPCEDQSCQSFYTAPPPDGEYGPAHREVWLEADRGGFLILDVVGDDIAFVEVLHRPDVAQALAASSVGVAAARAKAPCRDRGPA